jgi:hypothetical protein
MAADYDIPDATYDGTNPDPVEWANLWIKPAIVDLDARATELEEGGGGGGADLFPRISGRYYSTTHPVNPGNNDAGVFGTSGQKVFMLPFAVTAPQTLDRIAAHVFTAGAGGSLIRLGVYSQDEAFTTFTRLVSTFSAASSTGDKISTISLPLEVGMYWLAYGCTDTSGTLVTTRISKDGRHPGSIGAGAPQYQVTEFAPRWDGIDLSTDLPATLSVASIAQWIENDIPVVWVRKA